jgi:hypothetical protein
VRFAYEVLLSNFSECDLYYCVIEPKKIREPNSTHVLKASKFNWAQLVNLLRGTYLIKSDSVG